MAAQNQPAETDLEAPQRVKTLLAELTETDVWASVDMLAQNLDGLTEEQVGEVIAELQSGELAEPGDTIVTSKGQNGEFYQFESPDG